MISWPFSARQPAVTAPTYPKPKMLIFMRIRLPSNRIDMLPRDESREIELLNAQPLQASLQDETRIISQVPAPEPPGFLAKAIEPFQAGLLHPAGRLFHAACKKIEGRAHPDHHERIQLRQILRHEFVLLGSAQSNPKNIGPLQPHFFNESLLLS